MKNRAQLIHQEVSPKRLYTSVKEISDYHRIQVTPGFRAAAEYVCSSLQKNGIQAQILSYRADGDIWYLQNKMFKEWTLKEAYLDLDEPFMHLADAGEEPMSIVQRSYPADFTDGLEMIFMDRGTDPKAYEDVDLDNKIIFIHENFHSFEWAFDRGVKGFVTDYIAENPNRTRNDLYHSLTYTSFWWKHVDSEKKVFGFVMSPCEGDKLVKLYKERKAAGLPMVLKGKVDAVLEAGAMEVVEAVLPGETEEEVLLTSHLCHPKTSANDNASGCAANMEALRVLKKLMDEGKLPRNKRTIKAIFMPEFTGTFAYLSDHTDYDQMIGAINLDMVGGKQTRAYGPITLTLLPDSCPSIIQSLTHASLELAGMEAENLLGEKVPVTHYITETFFGGSDHLVYSNPDFNTPCCMLGQWPDLNYHTATDKLDVIDPEVLAFSCRTATNFAYALSNLSEEDLPMVFGYMHREMTEAFNRIQDAYSEGKITAEALYSHLSNRSAFFEGCVRDLRRILPSVSECVVERELNYVKTYAELMYSYMGAKKTECTCTDARVFEKLFIGPIQRLSDNLAVSCEAVQKKAAEYEAKYGFMFSEVGDRALTYINGTRTVGEVKQRVAFEFMKSCDDEIDAFFDLLTDMNMIKVK